ncbi:MAG: putative Na+/H+ antiporter [Desulfobacterales bacterium]
MRHSCKTGIVMVLLGLNFVFPTAGIVAAAQPVQSEAEAFPRSLRSYNDADPDSIWTILKNRAQQEPFNLVATLIFFLAIVHTFMTGRFMAIAHKWEHEHAEKIKNGQAHRDSVHHGAELFHFLGEVEVVFGIWAIALIGAIIGFYDWQTMVHYISYTVNYTEPLFVVVIMTLAATRPILRLSEAIIRKIAGLLGGSLTAQWLTVLTIGPLLGSFITEPAAMTISALVLARIFYELEPGQKFKYATLGLLFVNISVGGTLTHFAAPPVLMVAAPWKWTTVHMLTHFGWKAELGILLSNALYFLVFRKELARLEEKSMLVRLKDEIQQKYLIRMDMDARFQKFAQAVNAEQGTMAAVDRKIQELADEVRQRLERHYIPQLVDKGIDEELVRKAFQQRFERIKLRAIRRALPALLPDDQRGVFNDPDWDRRDDPVPAWITIVHVFFMAWTILNAHHPELFIPGLLFFLGFAEVTKPFQNRVDLKPALLVGFFLGGLVIHGGVQGWWIAPILGNLTEVPLMLGATILTAFNDNAAITFLSTLVPDFTDSLKYAVVAGAVAGGGLTIIANAPNPAGVSILKKYFNNEVSPGGILAGALVPTAIVWLIFLIFR